MEGNSILHFVVLKKDALAVDGGLQTVVAIADTDESESSRIFDCKNPIRVVGEVI